MLHLVKLVFWSFIINLEIHFGCCKIINLCSNTVRFYVGYVTPLFDDFNIYLDQIFIHV